MKSYEEVTKVEKNDLPKTKSKFFILPRIMGNLVGVFGGPALMKYAADTFEINYEKLRALKKSEVQNPELKIEEN